MPICEACNGEGAFSYPCKKCSGTGLYKHPVTNELQGRCRVCGGTGRFYPIWKGDRALKTFNFPYVIKKLPSGKEEFVHRCRACRGTGQVREQRKDNAAEIAHHALTGE